MTSLALRAGADSLPSTHGERSIKAGRSVGLAKGFAVRNSFTWWTHLVRSPRRVGSIAPSSPRLADHMTRRISAFAAHHRGARLIEVGAGTGAITRSLVKLIDPQSITLVEADPKCCEQLRRRFPQVQVIEGLVENLLEELIVPGQPLVLVSSVPLFSLSEEQRGHILSAYEKIISSARQCRVVQFTYVPWLPGAQAKRFCGREVGSVWRNLPPAWVWSSTHNS